MFEAEKKALKETLKLSRPTLRETMLVAALYAAQAVICIVLLKALYGQASLKGVLWAMIAAILALQPGLSQSVVTSIIRIAANTVGAGVALAVARFHLKGETDEMELILALIIVVFLCEGLRLNLALRTACVAAVIVLTANDGHVKTSAVERFSATLIGCMMALLVQLCTDLALKKLLPSRDIEPVKGPS